MHLKPFISLPLAFLATACISKVELVQTPILFDPVIGSEVRSETDMSVPFPEDETFGVWALDNTASSGYMDDCEIRYSGGEWTSDPAFLWPSSSSLSFLAYSPYSLAMRMEGGSLVLKEFDIRKDGQEILFARTLSGLTSGQGDVKLPFVHGLSKVDVRVANGFGDDVDVRIDGIVLKGVAMRGDFDTSRRTYWKADESSLEDIIIFDSGRDGEFLTGPKMQFIGDIHTIIPQAMNPAFEVSYSFRVDEGEWIDGQKESVQLRDAYWEAGRYYTYSLRINDMNLSYTTGIGHWIERN